jgi:hypothetical protein
MEQQIFKIVIVEGTTENVTQFMMPLKFIYYKKVYFNEQKLICWTLKKG